MFFPEILLYFFFFVFMNVRVFIGMGNISYLWELDRTVDMLIQRTRRKT